MSWFESRWAHRFANGDSVDSQLATLIELQKYDARIGALEAEATRLPKQIETIQVSLGEAKKTLEGLKARIDTGRKELRGKEKDLEVIAAKRAKQEARLYEVKTNKEYSAALLEIEESKQEKAKTEEDILGLMELQERLNGEIREAEVRFKTREDQGRQDEAVVRKKLTAVEEKLGNVRNERTTQTRDLPANLLADYEHIARARSGIAGHAVAWTGIYGGYHG